MIAAPFWDYDYDDYGRRGGGTENVKATITAAKDGKFACTIDREDWDISLAKESAQNPTKARHRRYRPHWHIVQYLDEPDAKFTKCGQLIEDGFKCEFDNRELCCQTDGQKPSLLAA
jgi:hypothetical protein